jgi:HK97 family phage prohead protease
MPAVKVERRSMQVRAGQGDEFALVGRAITYGKISSNELAPGLRERIVSGCFRSAIASGKDVKALVNHSSTDLPLGRTGNQTLVLTDSADGLDMRVQLDRTNNFHQSVFASVKRQDISEMSFAFVALEEHLTDETYLGQRCQVRNVKKADLFDVSIVNSAFYSNGATNVDSRTADAVADAERRERFRTIEEDFQRREKANSVLARIAVESRRSDLDDDDPDDELPDELLDRCRAALQEQCEGYRFLGATRRHVYGTDRAGDCHRWSYEVDPAGHIKLDNDSRQKMMADVAGKRWYRVAASWRMRRTGLRAHMDALAGR